MAQDPACLASIKQLKGTLCSQEHCDDAANANHAICTCQPPYLNGCLNNPASNCCSYTGASPVWVAAPGGGCYCCCSCFAHDTPVAISSTESRAISDILVGDMVYVADDSKLSSWSTKVVQFSAGTGARSTKSLMIKVDFGNETDYESLYVTQNQLFYMSDALLKRANKLVPGLDHLVRGDGSTVPVLMLTVGYFQKGIHHISTSQGLATSMDGHLILAKGIVCGDYALQLVNESALFVDNHHELPALGTKEYLEAYAHLPEITLHNVSTMAVKDLKATTPDDGVFYKKDETFIPFGSKGIANIPDDVNYFITKKQALDVKKKAPQYPVTSGAGIDMYKYLVKLFKGFYPGISFYLDADNDIPNAYSFIEYDTAFVVVNGGLIRTECVGFELLAFIMAHEVGHLYGGSPIGKNGYTCEGMADFAAISAVFPYIWFGMYSAPYVTEALKQADTFFGFIGPKNSDGLYGNRCNFISIDCRKSAMNAAASTKPLPFCAGGPADPFLEVTGATAVSLIQEVSVTITFNVPVNVDTATSLGNYVFDPKTAVYSIKMNPLNAAEVVISAAIIADSEYTVSAFNVLSEKDEPIIAGKNRAKFTLQPEPADISVNNN